MLEYLEELLDTYPESHYIYVQKLRDRLDQSWRNRDEGLCSD